MGAFSNKIVPGNLPDDSVNDLEIDWGAGINQVEASDIPLDTISGTYTGAAINVQDALEELEVSISNENLWDRSGTTLVTHNANDDLQIDNNISIGGSNNELRFYEGANYVGFEAPTLSADQIWVLPIADGNANDYLQTNGSGTLSWSKKVTTTRLTANTVLDATHEIVFCDTDGGAFTVTLPAGVDGTHYKIINCGSSGNNLTVTPDGTEKLYGDNASFTLFDSEIIDIEWETTENWY